MSKPYPFWVQYKLLNSSRIYANMKCYNLEEILVGSCQAQSSNLSSIFSLLLHKHIKNYLEISFMYNIALELHSP